jgi:nitroimidazol reductase NimA-like FMN-containing flavoprotein (pyridoxamine 5'-phosphate oxidase superfamily)
MAAITPASTRLDSRFSDSNAEPTSWAETLRILEQAELFWLSTVRPDGRPHVTPLVAAWGEGGIHIHTGATEQKYLNLQANGHVVLTTGSATWDCGLDVVVEGPAAQVTDKATLERLAPLWKDKWDGRWKLSAREGGFYEDPEDVGSVVFSVVPTKIYVYAKGDPFGATLHRF